MKQDQPNYEMQNPDPAYSEIGDPDLAESEMLNLDPVNFDMKDPILKRRIRF